MSIGEFELIHRYFSRTPSRFDVVEGVGDDCALLRPQAGKCLAMTTDTLVEGVHFLAGTNPENLGHKALAVSLSDLASMGATPAWVTLALTLPSSDENWLAAFSNGFRSLADLYGLELVGGDTTRGPLSITVQATGFVGEEGALRRSAAQWGDGIYLTGDLGLAGLGLEILLGHSNQRVPDAVAKLEKPQPRISAGIALAGFANACIDVSDGLAADLSHILKASGVGASLDWIALPLPSAVRQYIERGGDQWMPLRAGDDYELCFTVSADCEHELPGRMAEFRCSCVRIGRIDQQLGLRIKREGIIYNLDALGYQHFPGRK
ncbi:MAG: thiamine-phosphate kinase [Candidatus Methylumidiphilus sp.]